VNSVAFTVNGEALRVDVAARIHLADYLREQRLLTGTHLGCEHGVCGACTLLIDDAPARGCIAFPAALDGARIVTIEGLRDDPVMAALRAAFTAEHALQCGYCTPGMLITARDIVLRLPRADAARIRLELAGNLCRCTGYAGIVRAILRVLADPPALASPPVVAPLAALADEPGVATAAPATAPAGARPTEGRAGGETAFTQRLRLALPADAVWNALRDPSLVAACIPGAVIDAIDGGRVTGTMETALGPIRARFAGSAVLEYGADRTGSVTGEGSDRATATRLSGQARFAVLAEGAAASTLDIAIAYALRGPLAQFARGPVVRDFAAEIAALFARNLEATLHGVAPPPSRRLGVAGLLWRVLRRRLASLLGRRTGSG
jgi:carbon-monoxide dehydrogenase small subunit